MTNALLLLAIFLGLTFVGLVLIVGVMPELFPWELAR